MIIPAYLVLDVLNLGPLSIERRPVPVRDEFGRYIEQAPEIVVSPRHFIHTADGVEYETLPEYAQDREIIEVYTTIDLIFEDLTHAPDVVPYKGRKYRVANIKEYINVGGICISLASMIPRDDEPPI